MIVLPELHWKTKVTNLSFEESVGVFRRLGMMNVLVDSIAPVDR